MKTDLEQVKEFVSNLSPEELKKFIEWYEVERQKRLKGIENDSNVENEEADKVGSTA